MAYGIKYFEEDLLHYQEMIAADEAFIKALIRKKARMPSLAKEIAGNISSSRANILMFQQKIDNLIERGCDG